MEEVLSRWQASFQAAFGSQKLVIQLEDSIAVLTARGLWSVLTLPYLHTGAGAVIFQGLSKENIEGVVSRRERKQHSQKNRRAQARAQPSVAMDSGSGSGEISFANLVASESTAPEGAEVPVAEGASVSPVPESKPCEEDMDDKEEPVQHLFEPGHFEELAFKLCEWAPRLLPAGASTVEDVMRIEGHVKWLHVCAREIAESASERMKEKSCGRYGYRWNLQKLLECLLVSRRLRSAAVLKEVLNGALKLCLPKEIAETLADDLNNSKLPGKSELSRARQMIDIGYMLWMRGHNAAMAPALSMVAGTYSSGDTGIAHCTAESLGLTSVVRYGLADSSEYGGRDWFNHEWFSTLAEEVVPAWRVADELIRCLPSSATDSAEQFGDLEPEDNRALWRATERQSELSNIILSSVDHHIGVMCALGVQASTLVHKFALLMYALYLECGTWEAVRVFTLTVFTMTTDFGTESGLLDVPQIDFDVLFPFLMELVMSTGDTVRTPPMPLSTASYFWGALWIPDVLHMLHNATKDLTKGLAHFDTWMDRHRAVCAFVHHCKGRIVSTCFSTPQRHIPLRRSTALMRV